MDLLVSVHSLLAPAHANEKSSTPKSPSSSSSSSLEKDGSSSSPTADRSSVGRGDVDAQINTLVRAGLLERSSQDSVRFVAKYMVTIIYDMILHSKRQDMHKVHVR